MLGAAKADGIETDDGQTDWRPDTLLFSGLTGGQGLSEHDLGPAEEAAHPLRELYTPGKGLYLRGENCANPGTEAHVCGCFQDQARKREEGVGWVAAGGREGL